MTDMTTGAPAVGIRRTGIAAAVESAALMGSDRPPTSAAAEAEAAAAEAAVEAAVELELAAGILLRRAVVELAKAVAPAPRSGAQPGSSSAQVERLCSLPSLHLIHCQAPESRSDRAHAKTPAKAPFVAPRPAAGAGTWSTRSAEARRTEAGSTDGTAGPPEASLTLAVRTRPQRVPD